MVELEEISDCASREHALEAALDKMQADWQPLVFDLVPWRATGSYILKGAAVEEAQLLLDEHTVKTQAMKSSPFAAPIYEALVEWEKKLALIEGVLDEWLVCQTKWIYLEPVYGSEEILKQASGAKTGLSPALADPWPRSPSMPLDGH
jgi:dynein heavy chain